MQLITSEAPFGANRVQLQREGIQAFNNVVRLATLMPIREEE